MAGLGRKTFTAGDVLTAFDVQSYLQDQAVQVYAGTAARSSATPSPSEGMVSFRTDADVVEIYNGSTWATGFSTAAWLSFTPTLTAWSAGSGSTFDSKYVQIGKTVIWNMKYTSGTGATFVGNPTFSLPVTASTSGAYISASPAIFTAAGAFASGIAWIGTTTTVSLIAQNASATYVTGTNLSATVPGTWAVGNTVSFKLIYQAA